MPRAAVDGLEIAYADSGRDSHLGEREHRPARDLPILCLTGWCSSRARYDRLVPLLARGRRVVSVDWRGHGESAAPSGDFGHEEMVRDALAVIERAGLSELAVVASSHAGWVAIELRRRLRDRIPKIVHMDWLMFEPGERYIEVIEQLEGEQTWREGRDTLFEIWRGGVQDDGVDAAIEVMNRHQADMWMRSGREIGASFRESVSPLSAFSAMHSPPHVLHLYGQPRDPLYLERQQDFAAAHDWFEVRRLAARSHFTMIETPHEAAEAIEEFLQAES